jgi:hypothetical protein
MAASFIGGGNRAEASSQTTEHLHFAFAFVIIAAGLAIVASIFLCV